MHIIHRNTQTQYKQTCSCTQMFALCENRTRDLLRIRRVFPPLRQTEYIETDSEKKLCFILCYDYNNLLPGLDVLRILPPVSKVCLCHHNVCLLHELTLELLQCEEDEVLLDETRRRFFTRILGRQQNQTRREGICQV
jgi:hypothetical protein